MKTPVTTRRRNSLGLWLAGIGGTLMAVNAARAFADPIAFAAYLGLPLVDAGDAGMVHIYALRALFIALLVAALIISRQRTALALLAGCAVIMPLGDALLASGAAAVPATIARHLAIAVFLLVTAFILWRGRYDAQGAQ